MTKGLFIGTNYHPHDSVPDQWERDIRLMKQAGFNFVRMGHLAWDSYESKDGQFDFGWFDRVMDLMQQAGIRVVLDIAIRPAPLWLHRKHPGIQVVDPSGNRLYPNHRYMEDVGDPGYRKYALRYAKKLAEHYGNHPALIAFGIDNEPGDGRISYSESLRRRFIQWLRQKHGSLESLNTAWAGQRWSRRISDWDEIGLPLSGPVQGPPERVLDFRLFISSETDKLLQDVLDTVRKAAPKIETTTNAWFYSPAKYFDYAPIAYSGKMTRHGCGFYPGHALNNIEGITSALFGIERIRYEAETPFWCNEFTTMTAAPGSIRQSAYATLLHGNQAVCGWTWQSMHGGEEQYLQGMLDWDDGPNRAYSEYKRIADEFRLIEEWLPRRIHAQVALAFSFSSQIASQPFPILHDRQVQDCFGWFALRNIDTRVIDPDRSELDYKLLMIPGMAVISEHTAEKILKFVNNGGTAVMTAYSALVRPDGQVHHHRHPAFLADVFGIRVSGYEETRILNELSPRSFRNDSIGIACHGTEIVCESARFELIEVLGANVIARVTTLDKDYPVVTSHDFGRGTAIYIGLPAGHAILDLVLSKVVQNLKVETGPEVPGLVLARMIDSRHGLYLNLSDEIKTIKVPGQTRSLLYNRSYQDVFELLPHEPDFIEWPPA